MVHDKLIKNLKPGERVVRIIRRDLLASAGGITLAAIFILGDFFLLTFLLKYRPWGAVTFGVLLVIGLMVTIRVVVEWQMNSLVVTNERIIHVLQRGLFTRTVSEATHDNITDIKFSIKGFGQTILGLGSVEVQTAGEGENLRLSGVRHPQDIQALIAGTLRTSKRRSTPVSVHELVDVLGRMKREMGDDAFRAAVSEVEDRESDSVDA